MIIPIRVPVDAAIHTDGGIRQLGPEHPLFRVLCPACGSHLEDQPITLVYVGAHPEDRKASGWMTGAAVGVHAACAGVPTTPVDDPRCVCGGPIEWWTGPNESAGWIHSPSSETPILDVHRPRPRATASAAGEDPCLPRMSSPTQPSPARARFIEVLRSRGMLRPGEEWVIDVNLRAYARELAEQAQASIERVRAVGAQLDYDATAPGLAEPAREVLRDASRRIRTALAGTHKQDEEVLAEVHSDPDQLVDALREVLDLFVQVSGRDTDMGYHLPHLVPTETYERWRSVIAITAEGEDKGRVVQAGPRVGMHIFWDRPGEDELATFTAQLREAGFHIHATQQERDGRRCLEVTLP
ncbi:hypothetical protein [Streptomyces sp. NPDC088816]|uniref:hypothetical protein n=1 Tax=Streptomyces sp. NPDC088816 TaxID=3365906 RepID=UPI0038063EF7